MSTDAVRLLHAVTAEGPTDAELLERFVDRRDDGAFALLVRRHGPMVYGVCRRVLPTDQDAEDAFQATFLVLAQKARTVSPREAVGNWLYGVARRAALLARRGIARRRERVGDVPDLAPEGDPMDELRAVLDEELSRLPDVYRTAIVLCDLEGRTRRDAAAILGWPEGTVAGRLVRARELLARRLARYAPAVSVAAVLAGTASARVPAMESATRAVSAPVAALTREVLGAMARGKLITVATAVLLVGCTGFGMALQAGPEKASTPDAPVRADEKAAKPSKVDDVAWGVEADGLRAGVALVPADARSYRVGEVVELVVKLENVGRNPVTVNYPSSPLDGVDPQVVSAGTRVPVILPTTPLPKRVTRELVLRPGQTTTLGTARVALAGKPAIREVPFLDFTEPADAKAGTGAPTIVPRPGRHTVAYGGFLKSHPTLSTGAAAFEVTDGRLDDAFAWGKEVDGLQLGIGFGPGAKTSYRVGERVTLTVKFRNVGKAPVTYSAFGAPVREAVAAVRDATGKAVAVVQPIRLGGYRVAMEHTLKPGEEVTFGGTDVLGKPTGQAVLALEPPGGTATGDAHILRTTPGVYTVGYSSLVRSHPTLATGFAEFEVKADTPEPEAKKAARTLGEHTGTVRVAFSADGTALATFSDDTTVLLRDPASGKVRHRLAGHLHPVVAAAFSPDGNTLATADYKTVRTWDVAAGKAGEPLPGTFPTVQALAYAPDGKTLAVVSGRGNVELWAEGKVVRSFAAPAPEGVPVVVSSVRFSPDGKLLVVASTDGHPGPSHVRAWDPATGTVVRTVLEADKGRDVWAAVFSPDGKRLAAGDGRGRVTVFATADWTKERELEAGDQLRALAFAPDSRTLAVGLRRDVQVWDVAEGKRTATLEGHGNWVLSAAYSRARVLATGSSDKTARLWGP